MPIMIEEKDYTMAAAKLAVSVAHVKAVTTVESSGAGFIELGGIVTPKILFERHVMYSQVSTKFGRSKADAMAASYPDVCNPVSGGYGTIAAQPGRMQKAAELIDRECALCSASWGLFQIMGYHWKRLGYDNLQHFVNLMYAGEAYHLDAFVRFILADSNLLAALRAKNWAAFAKGYNGSAYAKNSYDTKLAAAYKAAGGI